MLKNLASLMTGTMGGQLLSFFFVPLIARIYSPEQYGEFSQVMTFCGIVAVVATLRLELAIAIPRSERTATALAWAGIGSATALSLIGAGLYSCAVIAGVLSGRDDLFISVSVVAIVPMAISATHIANNILIRKDKYSAIARISVSRSFFIGAAQVSARPLGAAGLSLGFLVGHVVVAIYSLRQRAVWDLLNRTSAKRVFGAVRRFKAFTTYGTIQSLLNSLSQSLPVFVTGAYLGVGEVGMYAVLHRVTHAPFALAGGALRQVLLGDFSKRIRSGLPCFKRYTNLTLVISAFFAPAVIAAYFFGPIIFVRFVGTQWWEAGSLVWWFTLWLAAAVTNTPALAVIVILQQQRLHAMYETILLVLRAIALVGGFYYSGFDGGMIAFCIVGFVANLALVVCAGALLRKTELAR